MAITYDPEKRAQALAERGLDFEDAKYVFEGVTLEVEDIRTDCGECELSAMDCWEVVWSLSVTRRVAWIVTSLA